MADLNFSEVVEEWMFGKEGSKAMRGGRERNTIDPKDLALWGLLD